MNHSETSIRPGDINLWQDWLAVVDLGFPKLHPKFKEAAHILLQTSMLGAPRVLDVEHDPDYDFLVSYIVRGPSHSEAKTNAARVMSIFLRDIRDANYRINLLTRNECYGKLPEDCPDFYSLNRVALPDYRFTQPHTAPVINFKSSN